eukprot:1468719-Amphidinium_carterae.2
MSCTTGLPSRMADCRSLMERTRAETATGKAARSPLVCKRSSNSPADPAAGTRGNPEVLTRDIAAF